MLLYVEHKHMTALMSAVDALLRETFDDKLGEALSALRQQLINESHTALYLRYLLDVGILPSASVSAPWKSMVCVGELVKGARYEIYTVYGELQTVKVLAGAFRMSDADAPIIYDTVIAWRAM